jgi:hypothetical protein
MKGWWGKLENCIAQIGERAVCRNIPQKKVHWKK